MALDTLPNPDADEDDGVVYPVSDAMGESYLQTFIHFTLMQLFRDYFATQERAVFVGSDQFFYYRRGDPRAVVSPDFYLIDETPEQNDIKSWKVWERGKVPDLALEIVSDEYRKDYADVLLDRYQQLGVRELVRYDPHHAGRPGRHLLSHWVREDGRLVPRPTLHDRVRSLTFDVWLVLQPDLSMRLGLGPHGATLWPTPAERARHEAERARHEAERAREAEAENRRLREELARLRGG